MIISFQHNYIFIRTKKTASSTIEAVLSQSMGPEDVVTGRSIEEIPARFLPLNGAGSEERPPFRAHMTAAEIEPWLPKAFWQNSFKFTVERHPYERAVSMAYYRMGRRQGEKRTGRVNTDTFEEFLDKLIRTGGYSSFQYYAVDNKPVIDDIVRQERLHEDLKRIGARLNIPIPDELPQLKVKFRADRRPAREILTDEQKAIIFEHCRPEFEFLGYER